MENRLDFVDALRGWAILGVIITHVGSLVSYSGRLYPVVSKAGLGVNLFFMISAFTIFLTLEHASNDKHIYVDFFIKRLIRIAPIYYLGIVIYTSMFGLNSRGWLPGPELWHYPLHILFLNLLHPQTPSSVVPGGWSISCEMLFYLMCPLLFMYITNIYRALVFCLLSIIAGALFLYFTKVYLTPKLSLIYGNTLTQLFFYRSLISQAACFSFGILLYYSLKNVEINKLLKEKIFNSSLLIVAFTILCLASAFRSVAHYVATLSFFLIALAMSARFNFALQNKAIIFLGRISFSVYILHFAFIHIVKNLFGTDNFYILSLATVLAVIFPAYLSFKFIEQKSSQLAKNIIKNRKIKAVQIIAG